MSTSLRQPVELSEQSSRQLSEGGEDDVFTESVVQCSRWGIGRRGAVLDPRHSPLPAPRKLVSARLFQGPFKNLMCPELQPLLEGALAASQFMPQY